MANRYSTVANRYSTVANRYVANRYCGESLVIRYLYTYYNVSLFVGYFYVFHTQSAGYVKIILLL